MNNLRFKITLGNDNMYRFTLLLADVIVVTDSKCYNSIADALDGIKNFRFVLDQSFEILENVDLIRNYELGLLKD